MMAALKNHPGMWMRDDAAAAIDALEDKYGVIRINRAGQTEAQQQSMIDKWDRGDRAGMFEPKRPARLSTHVINGGEAVDVYNYTDDRAKLEEFGFEWYGPKDPVHYTFTGWAGGATPDTKDESMDFFNLQGKGGSHQAGTFAVYRGNSDGKLYARRLTTGTVTAGVPTLPHEALAALKATMPLIDL